MSKPKPLSQEQKTRLIREIMLDIPNPASAAIIAAHEIATAAGMNRNMVSKAISLDLKSPAPVFCRTEQKGFYGLASKSAASKPARKVPAKKPAPAPEPVVPEPDDPVAQRFHYDESAGTICRTLRIDDSTYESRIPWKPDNVTKNPARDYFFAWLNGGQPLDNPYGDKGPTVRMADLFSGCGGGSLGMAYALRLLGYEPELALAADNRGSALAVLKQNFPEAYLYRDDADYMFMFEQYPNPFEICVDEADPEIAAMRGTIDVLLGGPPCQGNSLMNNHTRGADSKNKLYFTMAKAAFYLDVPVVIIENVKQVRSNKERTVASSIAEFQRRGYHVFEVQLNAADYGVAQVRNRHFLIAVKRHLAGSAERNVRDCIEFMKLPKPLTFDDVNHPANIHGEFALDPSYDAMLQKNVRHDPDTQKRINWLHDNDEHELCMRLRPHCHRKFGSRKNLPKRFWSPYGRMYGNLPSEPMTRQFTNFGSVRCCHPHEKRVINVREGARLQSFPDTFWRDAGSLGLSRADYCDMIGNAIPAQMMAPIIAGLFAGWHSAPGAGMVAE